jgi:hypothetical protein
VNLITALSIPARPFALFGLLVFAHWVAGFLFRRLPPGPLRTFLFKPRQLIKRPEDYAQ